MQLEQRSAQFYSTSECTRSRQKSANKCEVYLRWPQALQASKELPGGVGSVLRIGLYRCQQQQAASGSDLVLVEAISHVGQFNLEE